MYKSATQQAMPQRNRWAHKNFLHIHLQQQVVDTSKIALHKLFNAAEAFCEFYVNEKSFITSCILDSLFIPGCSFDLSFGFVAHAATNTRGKDNCGY